MKNTMNTNTTKTANRIPAIKKPDMPSKVKISDRYNSVLERVSLETNVYNYNYYNITEFPFNPILFKVKRVNDLPPVQ